jgi:hypothetical protein
MGIQRHIYIIHTTSSAFNGHIRPHIKLQHKERTPYATHRDDIIDGTYHPEDLSMLNAYPLQNPQPWTTCVIAASETHTWTASRLNWRYLLIER